MAKQRYSWVTKTAHQFIMHWHIRNPNLHWQYTVEHFYSGLLNSRQSKVSISSFRMGVTFCEESLFGTFQCTLNIDVSSIQGSRMEERHCKPCELTKITRKELMCCYQIAFPLEHSFRSMYYMMVKQLCTVLLLWEIALQWKSCWNLTLTWKLRLARNLYTVCGDQL